MSEFFLKLFDTSDFPARWHCGNWSVGNGWLHIVSDIATFLAYIAIPCVLIWLVRKRKDIVFPRLFWLFSAFIFACGSTHLIEAVIFWHPVYRFSGLMKGITAIVSWATVIAVIRVAPTALRLPSLLMLNEKLRNEVKERRAVEERLSSILNSISDGVMVSDREGNIEFMNPAAAAIFRFDTIERSYRERFRHYTLYSDNGTVLMTAPDLPLQRAGRGECVENIDVTVRCPKKELEAILELSANPVTNEANEITGGVAIFHDVSDLNRERSARLSSEARLAAILDSMSDGVAVASPNGALELVNPAAKAILGIGRIDTSPDGWSQAYGLYRPDDGQLCPADELPLIQALKGVSKVEKQLIVRNEFLQEDVLISVRAAPIHDHRKKTTGAVAVFHDITQTNRVEVERRNHILRLEQTTALAAAVTEATQNTPDDDAPLLRVVAKKLDVSWVGIATCTNDEAVEWRAMNEHSDEVFTTTIAKSDWDQLYCESLTSQPMMLEKLKTPNGIIRNVAVTELEQDGHTRGALMVARSTERLTDEELDSLQRLSVLIAPAIFTRQRLVEAQRHKQLIVSQLRDSRNQVDRLARVNTLGEITASIAHELNQPLTAIVNFTDEAHAMSKETLDSRGIEELKSLTHKAYEQAVRAGDILRSIRSIIRSDPGHFVCFDLLELIRETTGLLSDQTKGITVHIETAGRLDAVLLQADRTQIQQVLINLMTNAVTAVAEQDKKEITLAINESNDDVRISVSDSGTGIEASQIDHVFDAFFTTGSGGLGLGLKICRSIVELHGGHIEVTNSHLGGATFSVVIPKQDISREYAV